MSHYTVLIFGDNPEEQLEPFCEQTEDPQYLEFFDAEKEYRKDYDSGKETKKQWYPSDNMWLTHKEYRQLLNTGELIFSKHAPDRYFCGGNLEGDKDSERRKNVVRIDRWDEDKGSQRTKTYAEVTHFKREYTKDIKDKLLKDLKKNPPKEMKDAYDILAKRLSEEKDGFYVYEANIKLIDPPEEIPLNVLYPNYSRYLEEWHGCDKDEEVGKYGHWRNPNAKWDWYDLGGRWGGFFTLKDGTASDQATLGEIDFERMEKEAEKRAIENWEAAKKEKDTAKRYFCYGIGSDETKDNYIASCKKVSTFAVLKEGQWYEKGKMGWWCVTTGDKSQQTWDEEFDKLLKETPKDTLLSLFDCHI